MARRHGPRLDERTETMTAEALTCRSLGHAPSMIPTPAVQRAEHRRRGERLIKTRCSRGCTYWRDITVDLATGVTVSVKSGYDDPGSYLVHEKGTGRLPRTAARLAFFAVVGEPK